ncbi:riboflavin synthase [Phytoactinopolyspora halotolerans]|uniref:Riboflavin synthase n=1 Tax=Phytoactinopolyspora halotolerans TaxID=1981512 RepID=A0A6L9S9Q1_9ACTN|nr:riboflavin synthase [Phytoactinopolyspora halotolerans]NEE02105.1 riboflavin synthase [Phytoactinopolyspora halotolerans]
MFTGIVEELGSVVKLEVTDEWALLTLRGEKVTSDAVHGDSIAVNGVCLTVVDVDRGGATFTVDVMRETLDRSALGRLDADDPVNLERAVKVSDRLGGHIVQGHVDAVGVVLNRKRGERWDVVRIGLPSAVSRYVVEKGSIAVDGVSLTVSAVSAVSAVPALSGGGDDEWFEVSLIPTTLELTTLGRRQPGDEVNLEVDVIAKYVERLVTPERTR